MALKEVILDFGKLEQVEMQVEDIRIRSCLTRLDVRHAVCDNLGRRVRLGVQRCFDARAAAGRCDEQKQSGPGQADSRTHGSSSPKLRVPCYSGAGCRATVVRSDVAQGRCRGYDGPGFLGVDMDIRDFGGEFRLIDDIVAEFRNHHGVPLTVGDDAAVVPSGQGDFRVLTTDALVEGEHFKLGWSTPYQIGVKTLECNASDVAAMGAVPEFLLLNLVIRDGLSVEFVREIYRGIRERCDLHGITLLGGDTTKGPALMLSATLTGRTKRPVLRSGAKVGDLICVTGDVGGAAAACALMKLLTKDPTCIVGERNLVEAQFPRLLRRHAEPHCRLDASSVLGPVANAMIDVSDGVASEVRHVCNRSGVGAL
ncbi:MAG: thiamine-phosphate kinase, partial [Deltaproteobacteria bacterium]|nr:thiamine-phosphate kinase [Deltaproteobacteria bacterium]